MWERWGPDMVADGLKVSGDSAGCVIALMVALGFHPDKLDAIYRRVGEQSHATQPYYNPWNDTGSSKYVEDVLRDAILTDPQSYVRLQEMGFALGTTEFPYSHRWHTSFESNEDLLQVALGCMHVPFYCRAIRTRVRGSFCVDGAYGFKVCRGVVLLPLLTAALKPPVLTPTPLRCPPHAQCSTRSPLGRRPAARRRNTFCRHRPTRRGHAPV